MGAGDTTIANTIKENRDPAMDEEKERNPIETTRWDKATIAFTMLKAKTATTPILKHIDPDLIPVIVVYASKWAVSASLLQEYDGVYWTVTFVSRILKPNEINYGMMEKEGASST